VRDLKEVCGNQKKSSWFQEAGRTLSMLFLQESLNVVRRKCHGNRWIPAESQFFKVLVFSVFPCSSVLGPDQVVPQGKIDVTPYGVVPN
jgi:hypothetical protein